MEDSGVPVRMSVRELMKDEHKEERYALLRAWKRLAELPAENPNSFYQIAGFHGQPFVHSQVQWTPDCVPALLKIPEAPYWGGYCQHQNVLFPFWHRLYLVRLEQALQTVEPKAMIPYWDQTSEDSINHGIPDLLTKDTVKIADDKEVPNPLKSFVLRRALKYDNDNKNDEATDRCLKPKGYETCRFPYSGLHGSKWDEDRKSHNTIIYQKMITEKTTPEAQLNKHITEWLVHNKAFGSDGSNDGSDYGTGMKDAYKNCLEAPTYNIFSNTSSAMIPGSISPFVSLETPHNWMHLAIGGTSFSKKNDYAGFVGGAHGDMGFNETAAFDPIFYMHHCNIDRMFWIWQKKHNKTEKLEIKEDEGDKGVIPVKGQGPTPYQQANEKLTLDTPLHPFQQINGLPNTSRNAINIKRLEYDYSLGSFDAAHISPKETDNIKFNPIIKAEDEKDFLAKLTKQKKYSEIQPVDITNGQGTEKIPAAISEHMATKTIVTVSNIDLEAYGGSFVVFLSWSSGCLQKQIGFEGFFTRVNRKVCANCQKRPRTVTIKFDITDFAAKTQPVTRENLAVHTRSAHDDQKEENSIDNYYINLYRVYIPKSIF